MLNFILCRLSLYRGKFVCDRCWVFGSERGLAAVARELSESPSEGKILCPKLRDGSNGLYSDTA